MWDLLARLPRIVVSVRLGAVDQSVIRRSFAKGWWPEQDGVELFEPGRVAIVRCRYRAANIPTPWSRSTEEAG